MTTITELRKRKKQWLEDTFSESQLKKELKLSPAEIQMMKAETVYGKTRYQKKEVSCFLKLKDNNYV